MKSCLFVFLGIFVLASLAFTLGSIFFVSADTKVKEVPSPVEEVSQ